MNQFLVQNCFRLARVFRRLGKRLQQRDPAWQRILDDWRERDGEQTLRYDYDLSADSVVFDLGGFEGDWASEIYARYSAQIEVFEPHPAYANAIAKRFARNPKINIHPFGLAQKNTQLPLSVAAESSSVFNANNSGETIEVELRDMVTFMKEQSVEQVDLVKINIEGGEFELLEHLIAEQQIEKFQELQIQFHHFMPDARERMKRIQQQLAETHELTWQFEFLWENWRRKG
ncbi:MAG: FkbM family methyltransferase [Saprospiraceae bacterium]